MGIKENAQNLVSYLVNKRQSDEVRFDRPNKLLYLPNIGSRKLRD